MGGVASSEGSNLKCKGSNIRIWRRTLGSGGPGVAGFTPHAHRWGQQSKDSTGQDFTPGGIQVAGRKSRFAHLTPRCVYRIFWSVLCLLHRCQGSEKPSILTGLRSHRTGGLIAPSHRAPGPWIRPWFPPLSQSQGSSTKVVITAGTRLQALCSREPHQRPRGPGVRTDLYCRPQKNTFCAVVFNGQRSQHPSMVANTMRDGGSTVAPHLKLNHRDKMLCTG